MSTVAAPMSTDTEDSPSDARVIVMMTRVATTATTAVEAISADKLDEARKTIDKLRVQWSTLLNGNARQLQSRQKHVHTESGVEAMHHGTEVLGICNQVISEWARTRYQAVLDQGGPASVDDWQTVLDLTLPLCWNFQCDILVVHGRLPDALAQAIRARGQLRTFFIGPASETPVAAHITPVPDLDMIDQMVASQSRAAPKRYASLDLADGVASPEEVEAANALVSRAIQNLRMNWVTWQRFSSEWLQQGIDNLPRIAAAPDIHALGERYAGRPAIVVSPGPSLAKNIEFLRQAQGKALILAPLQVLRRLHREGIRPDFAVVLDSKDRASGSINFIEGIEPAFLPDLLACTAVHPQVLQSFPRVCYFSSASPIDQLTASAYQRPMPMLAAGSVAIACFKLALAWNCSVVMLVGQDLAFAGDKRYADSAGWDRPMPARTKTLPGYHGGTVQTGPDYFLFHHQFEEIAARVHREQPQVRLLNCTEGGAHISGFEQLPLAEALTRFVEPLTARAHPSTQPLAPPVPGLREGLARSLRASLSQVRDAIRLMGECETVAKKARAGGPSVRLRLTQLDKRMRTQVLAHKRFMQASADDIDDALTAWEAFDGLDAYLEGAKRFRDAAGEGLRVLEAQLLGALDTLKAA